MVGMEASRSIPIGLRVKLVLTPDKFVRVDELSSYSFQLVNAFTDSFRYVDRTRSNEFPRLVPLFDLASLSWAQGATGFPGPDGQGLKLRYCDHRI